MIVITIIYITCCILLINQDLSSEAMFSGLLTGLIAFYIGPLGLGIIWGIYYFWLFLYKKFSSKKHAGLKSFAIVASIIFALFALKTWGPLIFYSSKVKLEEAKISKKGRISSIERETVCVKENNKYVSYIVVDNKYAFTKNSLLVRKNALNKKLKYYESYEFEESDEYDEAEKAYDKTLIDKYLTSEEWLSRFDKNFLQTINNTLLYQWYSFTDYKIYRKFFIISSYEYDGFHSDDEWYNMSISGGMTEDWSYFGKEKEVYDDNGNLVKEWLVRIDDQNCSNFIVCSGDCQSIDSNYEAEHYFRPAFTISNDTKIKKNKDKRYDCQWFIDIN